MVLRAIAGLAVGIWGLLGFRVSVLRALHGFRFRVSTFWDSRLRLSSLWSAGLCWFAVSSFRVSDTGSIWRLSV